MSHTVAAVCISSHVMWMERCAANSLLHISPVTEAGPYLQHGALLDRSISIFDRIL